ncbi:YdcF family protein [Limnohabitans sp.]|jgi:uncharacterized SAM-binding protein YcdF (DUF218 family)|uniref:YdcF family protein n=1 Tax=Limnohabitans sp. TaxID=1907725 RepID=UPI0037BE61A6
MIELSEPDLRQITDYVFLPDRPLIADATIVLGQTLWHRPLQKSIEIYKAGAAGKVIFTGGFNPTLGCAEALSMKRAWARMGYCLNDVLVDRHASNTLENIQNAKVLMDRANLLKRGMAINVIAISYHMRRATETLKQVFSDDLIQIGIINYPSRYCPPDNWFHDPRGRSLVIGELIKIEKYLTMRSSPSIMHFSRTGLKNLKLDQSERD